ncbi:thioredoxin domain-containing protein [Pricia sp. S334]|uniref:Thioredoxin domain-containing protein n=1 Tax=Pricia mediterranea TaxID=3076079 RepID=A0ABU3L9J0_9FLAO|nr:thioredoxin domain-containing protein [Pricia sp. S334]MDT7830414.1 thioredoxin domain-containing protein [Pricia sp. S334]
MNFRIPSLLGAYLVLFFLCLFSCKESKDEKPDVSHKYSNALVDETSPYLLQHAHNPVNWRPWSQEALKDAEKENKLVLVSIGYSSCHWCHVMEEETFEDEAVAKIMNDNFINIKVDREERPDVDQVYMTALQLISGNGGWPLNVITLPNGKPLYGGTYHTKEQWTEVLKKISDLYHNDPAKAAEYADMVAAGIAEANLIEPAKDTEGLTEETVRTSVDKWKPNWDPKEGGDKGVQKFMIPGNLDFLLDYALLTGDDSAKDHVRLTLDKMASGGIYDQLEGGFFRYSTDAFWKVPHFEKMLYDNAQLISLYAKAYQIFKDPQYKTVVFETIAFLKREMKNPAGGYYAALNADSEGEEGKFYVWRKQELKSILGNDFDLFASYYSIGSEATWEDGKYILYKTMDDPTFTKAHGLGQNELKAAKQEWHDKLLKIKDKRTRPSTDDKIITSWNALLINGFVDAYEAFGQQKTLDEAMALFEFILNNSYQDGALVHTYKKGGRQKEGFLEDYSFLASASLKLYSATMDNAYLDFAQELTHEAETLFFDDASGMYRYNQNDLLIAKIIKTDDGVLPSPNAVMAHNLFVLGHIEYDTEYNDKAQRMLSAMLPMITEHAPSYSKWNALLLHTAYPYYEVAVVGKKAGPLVADLLRNYVPNTLVIGSTAESDLPLFKDRYFDDGTFIYVCRNTTCKLPVETVERALAQLKNF